MTNSILSPKTFKSYSLGCRTNQAEIEAINMRLADCGLRQGKIGEVPNLILLNTCVVTQKAEKETRKKIRRLKRLYPGSLLVVLGCGVTAREKFKITLPEADLFISNKDKDRVISLIEENYSSYLNKNPKIDLENKYVLSGRKFIKIQEGCANFCTFCITSLLRGKPKSTPPDEIIKEINFWLSKGVKEIILTGINISLYGKDLKKKTDLRQLIKKILNETGVERITLSSIYPEVLTKEFVSLILGSPRTTKSFHLSIQSASESVLERMGRNKNLNKLKKTLKEIKKKDPSFTFRADFIAGFPEETNEEFSKTLSFIKETSISFAHVFTFSKRKGTKAYQNIKEEKWQEVSEDIKKQRAKGINEAVSKNKKKEAKNLINTIQETLIVRKTKGGFEGLTKNNWPIKIKTMNHEQGTMEIKGQILPVKITDFESDQLLGEIFSLSK
ncbi:MiaB/RimO family radical SAM methylthiotransferase [Candidatus Microgenomates bacterium]|jgi:threonylcarbamoyladenosine tRNA methylthiotransferase MtaB|nr:MAG: MiaB/RimO family radical SAM methylthiotransferase [Candidatus Microgenomates bacterium]